MIPVRGDVRVWLASGVTDMRRGMNTLALQVQEALGRDPHAGDLFVFRGRRGDLVTLCITPLDSGQSQRLNILSFREVSRSPRDDFPQAYLNRLGFERRDGNLPRGRRHELRCRKHALADQAVDRADTDFEAPGRLVDADRLGPRRRRVERGDPEPLSKFTHADRRPGLAVNRLAPHPVHRDAEFTIRPVATQLAHDVDRAGPVVRPIAAGLDPGYPQFRMAAANPMDDHDRLIGLVVQIDHGFLDQQVGQPLFRPGIRRRCVPCRRQIMREPHQRRGTDLGT